MAKIGAMAENLKATMLACCAGWSRQVAAVNFPQDQFGGGDD